jgi:predicted proteasome-type protease
MWGRERYLIMDIVLARHPSDKVIAGLAAGPFEDLLVYHGDAFIERVEERAREDDAFNDLLGRVWRNSMKLRIWRRVGTARKNVW